MAGALNFFWFDQYWNTVFVCFRQSDVLYGIERPRRLPRIIERNSGLYPQRPFYESNNGTTELRRLWNDVGRIWIEFPGRHGRLSWRRGWRDWPHGLWRRR